MEKCDQRVSEHCQLTRRYFFQLGGAAAAAWSASPLAAQNAAADPQLQEAIAKLEYLTPLDRAFILDKGKAGVAKLPPEKLREIGLLPETWSLDVVPDPASDSSVEQPLSRALGNALDWKGLMSLAEKHAVRFLHVCTCTNGADPFHMTLWEGVPLREVIWLTRPKANIRRVYYQSYHAENLPPFQGSLPLGQILETPPGQTPVILAYKMNGQIIPAAHGGPVRVVVPGTYGSKSIKWVQRVVLTNDYKANDSDAELNQQRYGEPDEDAGQVYQCPEGNSAGKAVCLNRHGAGRHIGARQGSILRAFSKGTVAGGRPVLGQGRLEGRRYPAAACRLGWRAAGREVARQDKPDRSGQGHAPPMADALHDCPLGGIAPRLASRQLRPVLPHHRRQRHRSAHAAPVAEDRL